MLDDQTIKRIVEAALLAAHEPLSVDQLMDMFVDGELGDEQPRARLRELLKMLIEESVDRGAELKQVASGYRYQVPQNLSPWISRLWAEKPPRYSRALLETLSLIAYKQPVTRGDIEQVRGVAVSQNIMRTLLERGWIRVVGQREVPGRPSMYGTTREFLDYFNLRSLDQLPSLPEVRSLVEPVAEIDDDDAAPAASTLGPQTDAGAAEGGIHVALESDAPAEAGGNPHGDREVGADAETADVAAGPDDVGDATGAPTSDAVEGEGDDADAGQTLPGANVFVLPTVDKAQ